jgi:hypothetical protein
MLLSAALWLLFIAYLAGVVVPRLYWVLAGRRCTHCEQGRLSFRGLAANPWLRLRSWWRCQECSVDLHEGRWGQLETAQNTLETL